MFWRKSQLFFFSPLFFVNISSFYLYLTTMSLCLILSPCLLVIQTSLCKLKYFTMWLLSSTVYYFLEMVGNRLYIIVVITCAQSKLLIYWANRICLIIIQAVLFDLLWWCHTASDMPTFCSRWAIQASVNL
jgi:hypothetical protein